MSTAYNLYKNFIKKGFEKIGSGCYSVVFASKQDPNLVYKLGTSINDPCLEYLKLGLKNTHFPIINKLHIMDTYYLVEMEFLYPLEYTKWGFKDEIVRLVDKAMYKSISETSELDKLANIIASIANANEHFKVDLHKGNIMLRNNLTPVVIDPFSDTETGFPEDALDRWEERLYGESM